MMFDDVCVEESHGKLSLVWIWNYVRKACTVELITFLLMKHAFWATDFFFSWFNSFSNSWSGRRRIHLSFGHHQLWFATLLPTKLKCHVFPSQSWSTPTPVMLRNSFRKSFISSSVFSLSVEKFCRQTLSIKTVNHILRESSFILWETLLSIWWKRLEPPAAEAA